MRSSVLGITLTLLFVVGFACSDADFSSDDSKKKDGSQEAASASDDQTDRFGKAAGDDPSNGGNGNSQNASAQSNQPTCSSGLSLSGGFSLQSGSFGGAFTNGGESSQVSCGDIGVRDDANGRCVFSVNRKNLSQGDLDSVQVRIDGQPVNFDQNGTSNTAAKEGNYNVEVESRSNSTSSKCKVVYNVSSK
jgi:hypothetical protein